MLHMSLDFIVFPRVSPYFSSGDKVSSTTWHCQKSWLI